MGERSDVFDPVVHLLRLIRLPEEFQGFADSTHSSWPRPNLLTFRGSIHSVHSYIFQQRATTALAQANEQPALALSSSGLRPIDATPFNIVPIIPRSAVFTRTS